MKKGLRSNKGVSLVEVMVAMLLLGVVAVPLVRTFLDGFKFQARSQVKTEANKVIEYVAECLKNEQYSFMGLDVGDEVRDWASSGSGSFSVEISRVPGSELTATYKVDVEELSFAEIQKGGIGTPSSYEMEIDLANEDGYGNSFLNVDYSDEIIDIIQSGAPPFNYEWVGEPKREDYFYAILLTNSSGSPMKVKVSKEITEKVKFFIKGDIELSTFTDPELTREQKAFSQVKLGEKDKIKDEKEYLCEAKISAVNLADDSIMANMNTTFSVFVDNN